VGQIDRTLSLLAEPPVEPDLSRGYLDLLGAGWQSSGGIAQALMQASPVTKIYERWWRPALSWLAKGRGGGSMADEYVLAADLLAPRPGETVLDVACGPGNFTRHLAPAVGPDGLLVGIDASIPMLARAVEEQDPGNIGYVRGDAVDLPFRDRSFDAVCCFAALHLFDDPFAALDHMTRVLRPGGRFAVLTTVRQSIRPSVGGVGAGVAVGVSTVTRMRMFRRDEVVGALAERGYEDIRQEIAGAVQIAGAHLPP
jgi:SAM-dependent methyltransferase